jgi:hypothetical protein
MPAATFTAAVLPVFIGIDALFDVLLQPYALQSPCSLALMRS